MYRAAEKRVVLFGCPLDCDEKHDAIEEKCATTLAEGSAGDPLLPLLEALHRIVPDDQWHIGGSVPVPGWLRPIPPDSDRGRVKVDAMVDFIDGGGCREYANKVKNHVASTILPDLPCMVTVDHSLTGGVYAALAKHYGHKNLSLIVVDSHTDAIPMSRLVGAIAYDMETNPHSLYDPSDPFIKNRAESYNASTFIHHLVEAEVVVPKDLYIIGVSDYPAKKTLRIKDRRIADYVAAWTGLNRQGATIISKQDCQLKPAKVKNLLKKIRTPYVYVSIDMDIGARNAVEGVRFKNWQGMSVTRIERLIKEIARTGGKNLQLVGMDITEINPRIAGKPFRGVTDPTYQIAANLIEQLVYSREN